MQDVNRPAFGTVNENLASCLLLTSCSRVPSLVQGASTGQFALFCTPRSLVVDEHVKVHARHKHALSSARNSANKRPRDRVSICTRYFRDTFRRIRRQVKLHGNGLRQQEQEKSRNVSSTVHHVLRDCPIGNKKAQRPRQVYTAVSLL